MHKQKGYTLVEVVMVIVLVVCLGIAATALWGISHFIIKFW